MFSPRFSLSSIGATAYNEGTEDEEENLTCSDLTIDFIDDGIIIPFSEMTDDSWYNQHANCEEKFDI